MQDKIKPFDELSTLLEKERMEGKKVVHCHGVFDLLHPGHIRHLQEARKQGGTLVVSLTPDRFVNKGPGRPAFNENLRLEQLASLACVDYVVLNDSPDAVSAIKKIKPCIYVKGDEYQNHAADVTGKIAEEAEAVETAGGKVYYTNDITFSSSQLINRFFDPDSDRLQPFIEALKGCFSGDEILDAIKSFSHLKVLVVGDAILDEYQYVHPLGQSGKGVHLTAKLLNKEVFLGGSLIVANHLASFVKEVTLLTAVGKACPHLPFIKEHLAPNVQSQFVYFDALPTLTKKRYVLQDGKTISKLFETYSSNEPLLNEHATQKVLTYLDSWAPSFDLILVCDFGNGFSNPCVIEALSCLPNFLAVNTQTNSGNRGYNIITHYFRADFISLNEPELRLAAHDRYSRLEGIVEDMSQVLSCPFISVTRGVEGVSVFHPDGSYTIPALTMNAVDRVGAGDCYFALATLGAFMGYSPLMCGFLGSAAAALDVQIVGNREAISKTSVCKYITRLLK